MSAAIAMTVAAVEVYPLQKGQWMAYVTFENIGATRHQKPTLEVWSTCGLDAPPKVGDVLMVMPPRVVGRAGGGDGGDGREAAAPCSASEIECDVKRAISRMKVSIESAEHHLAAQTRSPLTVCFCLWSDLRKIEALLKKHDPKPNSQAQPREASG